MRKFLRVVVLVVVVVVMVVVVAVVVVMVVVVVVVFSDLVRSPRMTAAMHAPRRIHKVIKQYKQRDEH